MGLAVPRNRDDRFWAKVEKTDGCWLWTGAISGGTGYGGFAWELKPHLQTGAHRASWLLHNGEIPEGLWVLHHCDNRRCVRPDHLFLGTAKDNHTDMLVKGRERVVNWNARKTHCKHGHEFTPENTYVNNGQRRCQTCHRRHADEARARHPERVREINRRANARYRSKVTE